ncbi:MAG TPA: YHS domain-containing protein [Chloroflexia bacterium]|nr:YHS domain-containing protein [Chloroflexia bacterium]
MQVIDPVCRMTVETGDAKYQSEYQNHTYYFCSPGCKREFDKSPDNYTGHGAAQPDISTQWHPDQNQK